MNKKPALAAGVLIVIALLVVGAIVVLPKTSFFKLSNTASVTESVSALILSKSPDTTVGIHLGQFENRAVPSVSSEVGKVDVVWAALPTKLAPSPVVDLYHTPFMRETDGIVIGDEGTSSVLWFLQHHPDWIEYNCNAIGKTQAQATGDINALSPADPNATTTTDIAYEYFYDSVDGHYGSHPGQDAPLDISNPAVQLFMYQVYLDPEIRAGYQGIGFDNVSLANAYGNCGHFSATTGQFIQQYDSTSTPNYEDDPRWVNTVMSWAQYMYTHLHNIDAIDSMNLSYNFKVTPEQNAQLIPYVDMQVSEGGFSDLASGTGNSSVADWQTVFNYEQWVQSQGKGLFLGEYFEIHNTAQSYQNHDYPEHAIWTLANYLLLKEQHTYFTLTSNEEDPTLAYMLGSLGWIRPEYVAPIGSPINPVMTPDSQCGISLSANTSDPTAPYCSQGVYMRDYSNGKALVNPDPTQSYTITIPPGYRDVATNSPEPTQITMAPQSALVFLGTPEITSVPTPPNNNSNETEGVAGGGGGGSSFTTSSPPVTTVSTAPAYIFSTNLTIGSTGPDVTALQNLLISEGYITISTPSGYFGALTQSAVIKFQAAHGVSATGYVGPLTRQVLNEQNSSQVTTSSVTSSEAQATLVAHLRSLLAMLIAELDALLAANPTSK